MKKEQLKRIIKGMNSKFDTNVKALLSSTYLLNGIIDDHENPECILYDHVFNAICQQMRSGNLPKWKNIKISHISEYGVLIDPNGVVYHKEFEYPLIHKYIFNEDGILCVDVNNDYSNT